MTINVADGQRVKIWSWEDKGNYSLANLGSSRKDKKTDTYKNSSWGFVRFVDKAHKKLQNGEVEEKDTIYLKGATFGREPYEDASGELVYPKNATFTVFNFVTSLDEEVEEDETPKASTKKPQPKAKKGMDKPPVVVDDDDVPF